MKMRTFIVSLVAFLLSSFLSGARIGGGPDQLQPLRNADYRIALSLHEAGIHNLSGYIFDQVSQKTRRVEPEAYAILSDVTMKVPGYEGVMDAFIAAHPLEQ